jgi:hypothetical protein
VLSMLFALSCVLRVSFVCSLALVHVFRGEHVSFVLFCTFCRWCHALFASPRGAGRL